MIRIKERKEYGKVTGKDVGGCKSIREGMREDRGERRAII